MRKPELSIALIQVLRRAAWQARALGHSYVGTEHFLLSLLTAERAGGVLRSLGWEECTLRSVLLLERGRGSRAVPLDEQWDAPVSDDPAKRELFQAVMGLETKYRLTIYLYYYEGCSVKEVAAGYECGMSIEKYNDIKEGDIFECFVMEQIKD